MTKEIRIFNGEKTVSSINVAEKIIQLHVKNGIRILFNITYKNKFKRIKGLSITLDTIKFLEENIGRTLTKTAAISFLMHLLQ